MRLDRLLRNTVSTAAMRPVPQAAAERNMLFSIGLYADPLYFGDYPTAVRERVPHLQRFTPAERDALVNSVDFYAMNHYAARRARPAADDIASISDSDAAPSAAWMMRAAAGRILRC